MSESVNRQALEETFATAKDRTTIEDVSFVVIARNEEFAVERCLRALLSMPLDNCEILAIDSDSTDGTLDVMRRHASASAIVSVFRCSGHVNAAVARNVGLERAGKKYICFCDGDTEWESEFLRQALEIMEAGEADAVTGSLKNQVYSPSYERVLDTKARVSFPSQRTVYCCGGNFIVRRAVARDVGRWDERMVCNEDIDYTLRLSRRGHFIGIPRSMGIHHTQDYGAQEWREDVIKRWIRFHGAVLRRNCDRPRAIATLLRENRGFLAGYAFYALSVAAIAVVFITSWPPMYVAAAPLSFVVADLTWGALQGKRILRRFMEHYCCPPLILFGFLCGAGPNPAAPTVEQVC